MAGIFPFFGNFTRALAVAFCSFGDFFFPFFRDGGLVLDLFEGVLSVGVVRGSAFSIVFLVDFVKPCMGSSWMALMDVGLHQFHLWRQETLFLTIGFFHVVARYNDTKVAVAE